MNCLQAALAALVLLLTAGCTAPGNMPATMIEGTLRRVVKRHNAYVENDTGLTPLQKRTAKRDGTLLLRVLDEALPKEDGVAPVQSKTISGVQ